MDLDLRRFSPSIWEEKPSGDRDTALSSEQTFKEPIDQEIVDTRFNIRVNSSEDERRGTQTNHIPEGVGLPPPEREEEEEVVSHPTPSDSIDSLLGF